ncbi:MAG: hypothetical protein JXB49_01875 [Bacteroidales bacterium]|nr:hypothetical protein [Bacteroidales bacterium]
MNSRPLTPNEQAFVNKHLRNLKRGSVIGFIFLLFVTGALNGGYLYFRYLSPYEKQKTWMIITILFIDILIMGGFFYLALYHKRSKNIGISEVIRISGVYSYSLESDTAILEHQIGDRKVILKNVLSKHLKKGESVTAEAVVITRPIGKKGYFIDTLVLSVNEKYFVDREK